MIYLKGLMSVRRTLRCTRGVHGNGRLFPAGMVFPWIPVFNSPCNNKKWCFVWLVVCEHESHYTYI